MLLGPFTFLKLGKIHGKDFDRYELLPGLIEVYVEVLRRLTSAKAEWVQFDEPAFALDLTPKPSTLLLLQTYSQLAQAVPALKFMVATYFNDLGENLSDLRPASRPCACMWMSRARARKSSELISQIGPEKILSLGLVHGRNIWRNDYQRSLEINPPGGLAAGRRPGLARAIVLAASCALLAALRAEAESRDQIVAGLRRGKTGRAFRAAPGLRRQTGLVAKNRETAGSSRRPAR